MFHHLLSLQAGAYQNATWVLAAAKCGAEDGFAMIGGSVIVADSGPQAKCSGHEHFSDERRLFWSRTPAGKAPQSHRTSR